MHEKCYSLVWYILIKDILSPVGVIIFVICQLQSCFCFDHIFVYENYKGKNEDVDVESTKNYEISQGS